MSDDNQLVPQKAVFPLSIKVSLVFEGAYASNLVGLFQMLSTSIDDLFRFDTEEAI